MGVKVPYEEDKFVARDKEIELVNSKLGYAQKGAPNQRFLVEIYGAIGLGKSWLLEHLKVIHTRYRDPSVVSILVSLDQFDHEGGWYDLLHALVEQIRDQVGDIDASAFAPQAAPDEKRSELSGVFVNLVKGLQPCVPLFLFDASEKSTHILDWLEDEIVYPLLRTDRAVFVLAGRRWLRWKRFEVRRRVEALSLEPFDEQRDIPRMLDRLGVDRALAGELYQYAFGHPLTTRVIVDAIQAKEGEPQVLDAGRLSQEQSFIADIVRNSFIKDHLFSELGEKGQELQSLLDMLAVPRKFDVTPLKAFASRFDPEDGYEDRPGGFFLDAIRDLQSMTLVQWSSDWGGYILLPVLRWIMARNLFMGDRAKFICWHKRATEQYNEWIEQFPRNAVSFVIERAFHQAWVLRAQGQADQETASKVSDSFERTWEDVRGRADVQWDLPEMVVQLREKVRSDGEIKAFFPRVYVELASRVDKLVQP